MESNKDEQLDAYLQRHSEIPVGPPERIDRMISLPTPKGLKENKNEFCQSFEKFCDSHEMIGKIEEKKVINLDHVRSIKEEFEKDGWRPMFIMVDESIALFGLAKKKWGEWSYDD